MNRRTNLRLAWLYLLWLPLVARLRCVRPQRCPFPLPRVLRIRTRRVRLRTVAREGVALGSGQVTWASDDGTPVRRRIVLRTLAARRMQDARAAGRVYGVLTVLTSLLAVITGLALSAPSFVQQNVNGVGYKLALSAGQSNQVGQGVVDLARLDIIDPRIFQFGNPASAIGSNAPYANTISQAVEPLFNANAIAGTDGLGNIVHTCRRLLHTLPPNKRVLIIPCAYDGTGLHTTSRSWDPAQIPTDPLNLAAAAVVQATAAWNAAEAEYPGQNEWLLFSWNQGEADAGFMTQAQYGTAWDGMLAYFRANIPHFATCPTVVGPLVPEWIPTVAGADVIRLALMDTGYRNTLCAYVDGIPGHQNGTPPTVIHFDAAGQRANGKAKADALAIAKANVMGTPPVTPGTVTLTQSGFTTLATWVRPACRFTDFLVEYQLNGGAWATAGHTRSLDNNAVIPAQAVGTAVAVRISAVNEQGTSTPTAPMSVTIIDVPAQVTGLGTSGITASAVTLTWTASARAATYLVEQSVHSSGTWATTGTTSGTTLTAVGLIGATQYDFRVTAQNVAGNATVSATATATTLVPSTVSADVGRTPDLAYGLRKLVSGYAGPLIQVRRSSDNTTLDINATAGGDLDVAAMLAFCGAGDGFVAKLYDQTGAGNHAVQATTTKQAKIVAAGALAATLGGRPFLSFTSGCYYDLTTLPAAYTSGQFSLLYVAQCTTVPTAMTIYAEGKPAPSAGFGRYLHDISTADVTGTLFADDANSTWFTSVGTHNIAGAGAHQVTSHDTGSTFQTGVDGVFNTAASYSRSGHTLTLSQATVGATPGSAYTFFLVGLLAELVGWKTTVLNGTQEGAGRANQKGYYAIP